MGLKTGFSKKKAKILKKSLTLSGVDGNLLNVKVWFILKLSNVVAADGSRAEVNDFEVL
jgi:hypothetical protein